MSRPQAFARELQVATAGLNPEAIRALLAKTAREALAAAQSAGEAPETYVRVVNGRIGAPEESVEPPGPILYLFSWLSDVASYALAFAEERSPVKSGRFKKSWFVLVNGAPAVDLADIPPDAEVIVTNDRPYARKIEVGGMKMSVPPGIVEDTRQAVLRRFGNIVTAEKRFINLARPYKLRRGGELRYPALVVTSRF